MERQHALRGFRDRLSGMSLEEAVEEKLRSARPPQGQLPSQVVDILRTMIREAIEEECLLDRLGEAVLAEGFLP